MQNGRDNIGAAIDIIVPDVPAAFPEKLLPIRAMLLATFQDAMRSIAKGPPKPRINLHCNEPKRKYRKPRQKKPTAYHQAVEWVRGKETTKETGYAFSFDTVCTVLELNTEAAQEKINQYIVEQEVSSASGVPPKMPLRVRSNAGGKNGHITLRSPS